MTTTDDLLHDAYLEGLDSVKELVAKIAERAFKEGHEAGRFRPALEQPWTENFRNSDTKNGRLKID